MTRWETAGLPQLGEVVAAGDCTVAAGEGGVWRTDRMCLAPIPVVPLTGFEQIRFFRHQRTYQNLFLRDISLS